MIITGVFGIAALAWILSSKNSSSLLTSIGTTFQAIVKPLFPSP